MSIKNTMPVAPAKREIRSRVGIELRQVTEAEKADGYIGALCGEIPFNTDSGQLSERGVNNGKPFVEQIAPDAFKRSLAEDSDIMGFAGHTQDPLSAFARIGENLTITADGERMSYRALVLDTAAGRDLMTLTENKIIRGTSFEFSLRSGGEKWEKRGAVDVRTITDARLYTVNPVAFPAYPESELTVERSARGRFQNEVAWWDENLPVDALYASEALSFELCELQSALEYLRDQPAGAHADYAKTQVAESSAAITALVAWLAANGAAVPAEVADRATARTTEARMLISSFSEKLVSPRETGLRIFTK